MSCLCIRLSCHLTVSLQHATLGVRHGRLAHTGEGSMVRTHNITLEPPPHSWVEVLLLDPPPVLSRNRVNDLMDFDAAASTINWLASAISVTNLADVPPGLSRVAASIPFCQQSRKSKIICKCSTKLQVQQIGWKRVCKICKIWDNQIISQIYCI